eukprot:6458023-Amphidinium_carterae.1
MMCGLICLALLTAVTNTTMIMPRKAVASHDATPKVAAEDATSKSIVDFVCTASHLLQVSAGYAIKLTRAASLQRSEFMLSKDLSETMTPTVPAFVLIDIDTIAHSIDDISIGCQRELQEGAKPANTANNAMWSATTLRKLPATNIVDQVVLVGTDEWIWEPRTLQDCACQPRVDRVEGLG